MFRLIDLTTGEYLGNERTSLTFSDGKRAGRASKLASYVLNRKVQVRKAPTGDDNWRERERNRFSSGEYTPLEPALAYNMREFFPDHFAHVAKKRPDLIAYTKNEEKGRDDKQSLMSVKAYIEMIGKHPSLSWEDYYIERYVERQLRHAGISEKEYQLATTPDDIARVYTNYDPCSSSVSSSCMRYGEGHWPRVDGARFHPARVYGAGDLAVAYIANDDGRTVARAIVWPDKKIFSRVYAEGDHLHRLLKRDGYVGSSYHDGDTSIAGAKLLRVENDDGNLVCPYLDEEDMVGDNGDYLIIGQRDYSAQNTAGYIELRSKYICEHCEDSVEDDGDFTTVYLDSHRHTSEQWCEHCRDNRSFYCEGTNENYSIRRVDHTNVDGCTYTDRYLENNANWCEHSGEWTFDDLTTVIVDDDGRTQLWCDDALASDAYEWDGKWYSEDIESVEVVTERYVPRFKTDWYPTRRKGDGHLIYGHAFSNNVWFVDKVERKPDFIEDNSVMVGLDGRCYLQGYRDNYPLDRARMDIDLVTYMVYQEAA